MQHIISLLTEFKWPQYWLVFPSRSRTVVRLMPLHYSCDNYLKFSNNSTRVCPFSHPSPLSPYLGMLLFLCDYHPLDSAEPESTLKHFPIVLSQAWRVHVIFMLPTAYLSVLFCSAETSRQLLQVPPPQTMLHLIGFALDRLFLYEIIRHNWF